MGGWGGGVKSFCLIGYKQWGGTLGAGNTASGPMVTQPIPDAQASVQFWSADFWRRRQRQRRQSGQTGFRTADQTDAGRLHYHSATAWNASNRPPCCLGPHLPLTKNPNCVYLSDCLLAGSGTDWLTVNLSSRCTAEGNRITSQRLLDQSQAGVYMGKTPHTPPFWPFWAYSRTLPQGVELLV